MDNYILAAFGGALTVIIGIGGWVCTAVIFQGKKIAQHDVSIRMFDEVRTDVKELLKFDALKRSREGGQ